MSTLADILNPQSATDMAISVPGGAEVTYAEFGNEIERVAELLAGAGVQPGKAVSIVPAQQSGVHGRVSGSSAGGRNRRAAELRVHD